MHQDQVPRKLTVVSVPAGYESAGPASSTSNPPLTLAPEVAAGNWETETVHVARAVELAGTPLEAAAPPNVPLALRYWERVAVTVEGVAVVLLADGVTVSVVPLGSAT